MRARARLTINFCGNCEWIFARRERRGERDIFHPPPREHK
jgi:hypothetical protein